MSDAKVDQRSIFTIMESGGRAVLVRYGHPPMPYDVPTEPELLRHIEVCDPSKREVG